MTEIISIDRRAKKYEKHNLKIDMTPMVDLAFLLITFFIFTTSMTEHKGLRLVIPAEGPTTPSAQSETITVLLTGGDSLYYYQGQWQTALQKKQVLFTTYDLQNGLGKVIREKQQALGSKKQELLLVIKPSEESTYNNLINLLDEVEINQVKKYAIVDLSSAEKAFLKQ